MLEEKTYSKFIVLQPLLQERNRLMFGLLSVGIFLLTTGVIFHVGFHFLSTILYLPFLALCVFLQIQTYLDLGLGFMNEKLYICHYWGEKIFYKKELKTGNAHDVVILKYKLRQNATGPSVPGARLSLKSHTYEIHFLNKNHSNRNRILSLNSEVNALKAAEFIEQHSSLFYQNL